MNYEPTRLEIFLTRLAFCLCGKSVYQTFANRLPLEGEEQVLDFGCGMGTVAYYVAKRLPYGALTCLDTSKRWLNVCIKNLSKFDNTIFLLGEATLLLKESFDVVYCHFVLHDISDRELERVIPALVRSLKSGGMFIFREPLDEADKLNNMKRLIEHNHLLHKDSRITDIPRMGNALESVYVKL